MIVKKGGRAINKRYQIISKKDGSLLISFRTAESRARWVQANCERERGNWYMKHNCEPVDFAIA